MSATEFLKIIEKVKIKGANEAEMNFWKELADEITPEERKNLTNNLILQYGLEK